METIQIGPNKSYIYTGPRDGLSLEEQFKKVGVITLPIIPEDQLECIHTEFIDTLKSFPEYNHPTVFYVAGGFGALGNPSSFHNPLVRKLVHMAYPKVREFFQTIYKNNNLKKFYTVKDRMMFRPAHKAATSESWHRDVIGKEVYGGWINTDPTKSQYFTFIPGSHIGIDPEKIDKGFALVSKYIDPKKLQPYQHRIEILPGHIIIFPQYIIHTVESKKQDYDITRLFTGWVITENETTTDPEFEIVDQILDNQKVPPIPGGMIPPLFSPNHYNFLFREFDWGHGVKTSLSYWAKNTFNSKIHIQKYSKTHDKTYTFIPRYMKSLKEYDFKLYPPYTDKERALYKPSKLFG